MRPHGPCRSWRHDSGSLGLEALCLLNRTHPPSHTLHHLWIWSTPEKMRQHLALTGLDVVFPGLTARALQAQKLQRVVCTIFSGSVYTIGCRPDPGCRRPAAASTHLLVTLLHHLNLGGVQTHSPYHGMYTPRHTTLSIVRVSIEQEPRRTLAD